MTTAELQALRASLKEGQVPPLAFWEEVFDLLAERLAIREYVEPVRVKIVYQGPSKFGPDHYREDYVEADKAHDALVSMMRDVGAPEGLVDQAILNRSTEFIPSVSIVVEK